LGERAFWRCHTIPAGPNYISDMLRARQLGLGTELIYPVIPVPTEIALPRRVRCLGTWAGGLTTYFVTEHSDDGHVDLMAAGNGQFGNIGNGNWANQTYPTRVKTVSGLFECMRSLFRWMFFFLVVADPPPELTGSEVDGVLRPIRIHDVSVGKTHVAVTLDNAVVQPDATFGRDVVMFG
jgi:hypothetical protein